ncbi:CDP-glycerol glycerophosphotransferase family protein [Glaciihabitans sp. UYNi722]|uniref:CDP-glycerol glycerophosphotransferase family protein n=1 Tax=Glaciihabitans sp. UYNi722 TaxID=3156344 RepID=UPI003396551B
MSAVSRRVTSLRRRLRQAAKTEVYAFWRRRAVRSTTVLYESFAGNGMLCNPEAIFRALVDDPQFADLTHVWVLTSKRENPFVVREFARSRSVRFVRPGSIGYYRALATAGYLVNNATFPSEFSKRAGQRYLNTWHGTPLKRMGYDIGDPATRVANVVRNLLSADFLLSASPFMTEHMYEKAHLLGQIYDGRVIEEGYPRIDRQVLDSTSIASTRARLEEGGVAIGGRQVILYAPTWKGTSFSRPEDDLSELVSRVEHLETLIDTTKYVVLLKTHQVVHRYASDIPGLAGRLIPNEIPTNVILGITDLLVTDYSSIFFDFLATGRPLFFLAPDLADYAGYRGLYIEPAEWPGPVVGTVTKLAQAVNEFDREGVSDDIALKYRAMQARFVAREDGVATKRIVDIVFRGNTDGYAVAPIAHDERRTMLIHGGGMRPNRVTSELIALLDRIDHSRFDVSVVFPPTRGRSVRDQQRLLNPHVRQLVRVGGMNGSKLSLARLRSHRSAGARSQADLSRETRLWRDEWDRCFGSTTFDLTLDFAGTSSFWATLMLHSPGSERSIWLRPDRVGPAEELAKIRSLYDAFDHLVSDSPGEGMALQNFSQAQSLIGGGRLLAEAALPVQSGDGESPTPGWLAETGTAGDLRIFASLGGLSHENNPRRLLRAFALVHSEALESRLVVIGHGPLASLLEADVESFGLTGAVWLAGYRANPFAILRRSLGFVYTGQALGPRVVREARVLGLPIVAVASEFGGAGAQSGVLEIARDDRAVADGMVDILGGAIGASSIDWAAGDDASLADFYRAVGVLRDE